MVSNVGVACLGTSAAAAAAWAIWKRRESRKTRFPDGGKDDDLIGVVGWTSRICAAARALETEQPDRLYADPLAEALAGDEAMAWLRDRADSGGAGDRADGMGDFMGTYPDKSGAVERRFGYFNLRTKYLDDALLRFLSREPPEPAQRARQVVLLGAGMDTRAWRMSTLPPGTRWFEVDQASVLDVKRRLLTRIGAELPPVGGAAAAAGRPTQPPKFPLQVASYGGAAGDLADGTWVASLRSAGWDPASPTVFLAEGLTRYLKPEVLEATFRAAAQAAPGSTFIATMQSQSAVNELKERSARGWMASVNDHVYWGFPDDPAEMKALFEGLGWWQTGSETSASSAFAVAGANAKFSFSLDKEDAGRGYTFFIAQNIRP